MAISVGLLMIVAPFVGTGLAAKPSPETITIADVLRTGGVGIDHLDPVFIEEDCEADAPLFCVTGLHQRNVASMTTGFYISQPGLTATLETRLTHAAGEVRFQCTWVGGSWTGCAIVQLVWPNMGDLFVHSCWAYASGGANAVPGGSGSHSCFVRHG